MSETTTITIVLIVLSLIAAIIIARKAETFSPFQTIVPTNTIVPVRQHMFPQQDVLPASKWGQVSANMYKQAPAMLAGRYLSFPNQDVNICSSHDGFVAPRAQQDCPDSSFDFVTDVSPFVAGQQGSSCIQLGIQDYPFCYSDPRGKYHPNWTKIKVSSP
jgi:hypothetical protein